MSLDLDRLFKVGRKVLVDKLAQIIGRKTLILDEELTDLFSLWFDTTLLSEQGIVGQYHLLRDSAKIDAPNTISVYVTKPNASSVRGVIQKIQQQHAQDKEEGKISLASHVMLYPPSSSTLVEHMLSKAGLVTTLVHPLNLPFLPTAPGLLSLELDLSYDNVYYDEDPTFLHLSAQALISWQHLYGLFPKIIGKGNLAKKLAERLVQMRAESQMNDPTTLKGDDIDNPVDSLIIIDRQVDMITPLCLQLTYEGLIEEIYHPKHFHVELDKSLFAKEGTSVQGKQRYHLDSKKDLLLDHLRDLNFAVVANQLNHMAKRISSDYDERHQAKTVKEIRTFVGKLGDLQTEHQNLQLHTGLAERILKHTSGTLFSQVLQIQQDLLAGIEPWTQYEKLDNLIACQTPLSAILRLLCLISMLSGGLKPARLDQFKSDILQTYGYDYLSLLIHLEKLGWLAKVPQSGARPVMSLVRKPLNLIVEDVEEKDPQDISYVYSGYAPLSVRLVQAAAQKTAIHRDASRAKGQTPGWRMFEGVLKSIPGETFDIPQKVDPDTERMQRLVSLQEKRTTVVFFLGGCTSTEVSALRFMTKMDPHGRTFLAATTGMISGHGLLNDLSTKPLKSPW